MVECFKCGTEKNSSQFFDVISDEGIVKICPACQKEEDLPVVRRPTTYQLKEAEKGGTIYERLSNIAGLNAKDHLRKFHPDEARKREEIQKQDISLRSLVDKNYQEKLKQGMDTGKIKDDLVDNFHWIIMRERRRKKLTQEQFAKEIGESAAAIKMAEQGVLPEDDYRLIRKVEAFLGIILMKSRLKKNLSVESNDLFDSVGSKEITIGDLKELKQAQDTTEIVEEIEEDIEINKKGRSFFDKLFGRKNKEKEEIEEDIVLDEEIDEGEKKS